MTKCIFIDQECFKLKNHCQHLIEVNIKELVELFNHTKESAGELTMLNWKKLTPYCLWSKEGCWEQFRLKTRS